MCVCQHGDNPRKCLPATPPFPVYDFFQGTAMAGAVLALEWVPTNSRYWVEITGQLFWSTGVCAIAMFGYLLQNYSWRYLQMAFTLYSSFCLVQYWYVPKETSVRTIPSVVNIFLGQLSM